MALQNRVTPHGELVATSARGTMFGNRGGQFHDGEQRLGRRRWASRQWLCCALEFKGRHIERLMAPGHYTELFFLDETTAFAAGHRPCFECRRADAVRFRQAWFDGNRERLGLGQLPAAGDLDRVLHRERLAAAGWSALERRRAEELVAGAMVVSPGDRDDVWLVIEPGVARRWRVEGYGEKRALEGEVLVLTPASTLRAFEAGYAPAMHPSARA